MLQETVKLIGAFFMVMVASILIVAFSELASIPLNMLINSIN